MKDVIDTLNDLFDNLDKWRHLPAYQLERRADIFFAFYLKDILKGKFGGKEWFIIPEFPIQKKLVEESKKDDSFKIDYLAVAKDINKLFFLELKTDNLSKKRKQDTNMAKAVEKEFYIILEGLREIFIATDMKKKYYNLFNLLKLEGLVRFDDDLGSMIFSKRRKKQEVKEIIKDKNKITINPNEEPILNVKPQLVYILPTKDSKIAGDIITFEDISNILLNIKDKNYLLERFLNSLKDWSSVTAGDQML